MKTSTIKNPKSICVAVLFAFAITLLPFVSSNSQAYAAGPPLIWTGAVNNYFSDPGNWQGSVAPVTGDDLVFDGNVSAFTSAGVINDSLIVPNDIEIRNQGLSSSYIHMNNIMPTGSVTTDGTFRGGIELANNDLSFTFDDSTTPFASFVRAGNSWVITHAYIYVEKSNMSTIDLAQLFGAPVSFDQGSSIFLFIENASEVDVTLTGIASASTNQVVVRTSLFDNVMLNTYDSNAHLKFVSLGVCGVGSAIVLYNTDINLGTSSTIAETCNNPTPVVPPADPVVPDNTEYLPSTGDIVIVEALHIIRIAAIACILIMLHRGFCMRRRVGE